MVTAIELAEKAQRVAGQAHDAHVRIVGLWIWVDFASKPAVAVRDMLKSEGFRWNRKRGCWQFACILTAQSPHGRDYIENKYGVEEVEVAIA